MARKKAEEKNDNSQKMGINQQAESNDTDKLITQLPEETKKNILELKGKIDEFKKRLLEKFSNYVVGIALLPPENKEDEKKDGKQQLPLLVLVDDSDSKKMSKDELSLKLASIVEQMAREVDEKLVPKTVLLSELWQSCYDGKYELLQTIAMAAPVYDNGMLSAIKIGEIHKSMVIKKFEKYIVSYVLAGSLVKGKATKNSDIDVWVVIDDTDVKRMTRAELKDKLRAIIISMGIEAGEITGIKNKLNIQVYILTDFWDSLREANPIIFTLLRDGVPLYDRGIFMPWKQLLKMGRIKPSQEAIDMFMSTGEQMLNHVETKLKDIGMEDIYYAILTPSQAALMLYGVPPPAPRETAEMMREIFVKKEGLLEEKYVDILERNIKVRKDIEHGEKKELTGKEIDQLLTDAKAYLKRIQRLFSQINKMKEEESMRSIYESTITAVRDILKTEGITQASEEEIAELFEKHLVNTGKMPEKFSRLLREIIKGKKDYEERKLDKAELQRLKNSFSEFIKYVIEYLQRYHVQQIERVKIKIKYDENKYAEVIMLEKAAFIIKTEQEGKKVQMANVNEDGEISELRESSFEEMDSELAKLEKAPVVFIKEKSFESLKKIFGPKMEILINA
ncbi:MAG: nucleotidyltransferase domain-containing protein [Candidatus Woesearchaeota archaeon]